MVDNYIRTSKKYSYTLTSLAGRSYHSEPFTPLPLAGWNLFFFIQLISSKMKKEVSPYFSSNSSILVKVNLFSLSKKLIIIF